MPYEGSRGKQCIVVGCNNNQRDIYNWKESMCDLHGDKHKHCICIAPFRFHCLPKNGERRREWLREVNRKDYNPTGKALSKRKGLSVEEKRQRMMEFFFEKKDFFQLKELERMCQKEKGITSMSVKDILTSLVDDGMVDTDKIGTSVYFWAFPSKASQNRKTKINDLTGKLKETQDRVKQLTEQVASAIVGKEDSVAAESSLKVKQKTPSAPDQDNRAELLSELTAVQEEKTQLEAELERYRECDPEVIEGIKKETKTSKEAANRWTDNIFSTKSWIKRKFSFEDSVIDKQFEIPEDLDYLE